MLRYLGEKQAADQIEIAIRTVLACGTVRTGDLGGKANTNQFVDAVLALMS
jgi:isocitrate dehydrogenase (NAD+)